MRPRHARERDAQLRQRVHSWSVVERDRVAPTKLVENGAVVGQLVVSDHADYRPHLSEFDQPLGDRVAVSWHAAGIEQVAAQRRRLAAALARVVGDPAQNAHRLTD